MITHRGSGETPRFHGGLFAVELPQRTSFVNPKIGPPSGFENRRAKCPIYDTCQMIQHCRHLNHQQVVWRHDFTEECSRSVPPRAGFSPRAVEEHDRRPDDRSGAEQDCENPEDRRCFVSTNIRSLMLRL